MTTSSPVFNAPVRALQATRRVLISREVLLCRVAYAPLTYEVHRDRLYRCAPRPGNLAGAVARDTFRDRVLPVC